MQFIHDYIMYLYTTGGDFHSMKKTKIFWQRYINSSDSSENLTQFSRHSHKHRMKMYSGKTKDGISLLLRLGFQVILSFLYNAIFTKEIKNVNKSN